MNDRFHYSMRIFRSLLWLLTACIVVLVHGCSKTEGVPADENNGPVEVRLLIDANGVSRTRAGDTDVSAIRQLRVYVFTPDSRLAGYYYNPAVSASGNTYYIPMRLTEGGRLHFYIIANEAGARLHIYRNSTLTDETLSENSTHADVYSAVFWRKDIDREKGDLMTGYVAASVNNTDVVSVVESSLERDFSELDVFVAKSDVSIDVSVTGMELIDFTTGGSIFEKYDTWQHPYATAPEQLITDKQTVNRVVNEAEAEERDAYGNDPITRSVLTYHPDGSGNWNVPPATLKKPALRINYIMDGVEKNATVYLPPVTQNLRINVCCLVKATGVGMQVDVLPWTREDINIEWTDSREYELTFGKQQDQTAAGENSERYFAIKHTGSTTDEQDANDLIVNFTLTKPEGARWVASLGNGQDFYFVNPEDATDRSYVPAGSGNGVQSSFRIRAASPCNAADPQQTQFVIRMQQSDFTWGRLLINRDLSFTSGTQDVIWIKQVPNS